MQNGGSTESVSLASSLCKMMLATTTAVLTALTTLAGVKAWYYPPNAPGVINPLGKGQE